MSPVRGQPVQRIPCPTCGAEIITQAGSRRDPVHMRVRHNPDGTHAMVRVR